MLSNSSVSNKNTMMRTDKVIMREKKAVTLVATAFLIVMTAIRK